MDLTGSWELEALARYILSSDIQACTLLNYWRTYVVANASNNNVQLWVLLEQ